MTTDVPKEINPLEYAALLDLDKMVRLVIAIPGTGEFLVGAVHALDRVRADFNLPIPDKVEPPKKGQDPEQASALAQALIRRSMNS